MESIMEAIVRSGIDERLNASLLEDPEAIKLSENMKDASIEFQFVIEKLSESDAADINNYIDACAEYTEIYGDMAYRQGVEDTIELLKNLGIIR